MFLSRETHLATADLQSTTNQLGCVAVSFLDYSHNCILITHENIFPPSFPSSFNHHVSVFTPHADQNPEVLHYLVFVLQNLVL